MVVVFNERVSKRLESLEYVSQSFHGTDFAAQSQLPFLEQTRLCALSFDFAVQAQQDETKGHSHGWRNSTTVDKEGDSDLLVAYILWRYNSKPETRDMLLQAYNMRSLIVLLDGIDEAAGFR